MKVLKEHFDKKETQQRFTLWLQAIGATVGDEVEIVDFILWVSEHKQNFYKQEGLHPWAEIGVGDRNERFGTYLRSLVKQSKQMKCEGTF